MSWVSSGGVVGSPLLPGNSCPEGPWFAFFALEIEQEELEEKTGLWKEVQKELASMTGKPSVDAALKVYLSFYPNIVLVIPHLYLTFH